MFSCRRWLFYKNITDPTPSSFANRDLPVLPLYLFVFAYCLYLLCFDFLIIFYWLCYYSCPDFSHYTPLHSALPLLQTIPPPLFMSIGHVCKFFGCSISYTVLYIVMAILYYLFVLLNPLTSSPIPTPIWQQTKCSRYPWFCLCSSYFLSLFFRFNCFFLRFYLFIFRQRRMEGEKEGEKHQCMVASHPPQSRGLTGDWTCNPGICPD